MKVTFDSKYHNLILETESDEEKQRLENEFHFCDGSAPWTYTKNGYHGMAEINKADGLDIEQLGDYFGPQKPRRIRIGIRKAIWNHY